MNGRENMGLIKWSTTLAAVLVLGAATAAQAAPVTVGSLLVGPYSEGKATGGSGTFLNLAFGEPGARPTSPVSGAIVSWRVTDASGAFRVRVLRPAGGTAYTSVASSPTQIASGGFGTGIQTFAAAVPIQAGDTIGLDIANGNEIGIQTTDPSDVAAVWSPALPDGATLPFTASENEIEVGFNATVQPAPALASVAPASGPIKGGTAVTVTGTDFAGVSGVSFGGTPATSFAVGSEGQLLAVAPPHKVGKVDVTVTTVAGTTPVTAADKFSYKGCVVPKLKGKTLKTAKKKLRKASCKLGKVKFRGSATAKTGKVVKQSRKAGKQLATGTRVSLTLG
jgi:large repetitive protein